MNRQNCKNFHCIGGSLPNNFFPASFEPGQNDVVIGRGRNCNYHKGNERLRRIVYSRMEEYAAADKETKSYIISSIVDQIKMGTPKGSFVKQDLSTTMWFDVGFSTAREKVSRMFREALQLKLTAFSKSKYHTMDTKSHTIVIDPQSKEEAKWTEDNNQNSRWTNDHFRDLGPTYVDVGVPHEPNQFVEPVKKELSCTNGIFVPEDTSHCKSQSALLESEDDWLGIFQNFIDFTKTDEFENFDISRTYIHFAARR